MKGAWRQFLLALPFFAAPYATAADDMDRLLAADLDALMSMTVSISTQSQKSISKTPATVSVITAEDLQATGASDLVDVLQTLPGVNIRHNQFGLRPLVSVRGAAPKNALILVNGAPMRDLVWATGIFWRGLPASMIDRIEVIRGPGSALYGSDASSGVINVITRTAAPINDPEAGVRIGSFDTRTAWLKQGGIWNGFDVGLTLEAMSTDSHRPWIGRDFGNRAGNAEFGYDNLDLRLSVARDHWRLLFDHMGKDDVRVGIAGGSNLDPRTRAWERQTGLAWLYDNDHFVPGWHVDAELRFRDLEYSSGTGFWEDPGTLNQQGLGERRYNAEIGFVHTGLPGHQIRFGAGHVWQDLHYARPASFVPARLRRNAYLFAQDVWNFADDWELTVGGRYDRFSEFGSALNPRLALVWETSERLTSKLMVGKSFRVPSFLELYADTGATRPNPGLRPERALTWDLSFNWRASKDLNLGFTLFDYLQKNPIVVPSGSLVFVNVDPHRIRGIELEAVWQAHRNLRLSGNFSVRRPDNEQFERIRVADHFAIPRQDASLRIDWAFAPKWHWNLQAYWVGKRSKSPTDARPALGAQTTVDTTLRYFHGSDWEFAASVRNLLDADVREYTGTRIPDHLPLPRRHAWAEVRYKF